MRDYSGVRGVQGVQGGARSQNPGVRRDGAWRVVERASLARPRELGSDERGWSDVGMSSGDHFKTFEYRCLQIRQDGQKITAGFSSLAIRLTSYGSHYPHGHAV